MTARSVKICEALNRLIPNMGELRASRRRLYGYVTQLVMLYAAPVWTGALNAARNRKKLGYVQRRAALRPCSAYRTIWKSVAPTITGTQRGMVREHGEAFEKR